MRNHDGEFLEVEEVQCPVRGLLTWSILDTLLDSKWHAANLFDQPIDSIFDVR